MEHTAQPLWRCASSGATSKHDPIDVVAVVTGGRWKAGSLQGVYRVVVRTGGFEHLVSQAQVDWIAYPGPESGEARLVKSMIAPTGSWRLDNPRLFKSGNTWRVELEGLETHFVPAERGKWVVRLGGPGKLWSQQVRR